MQDTEKAELPTQFPLRDGLVLHGRSDSGTHWTLEDTERGQFFRLGKAEQAFLSELLLSHDASTAFERCTESSQAASISQSRAMRLCKWLDANGLTRASASATKKPAPSSNPLMAFYHWKLPLVNPDEWLNSLHRSCGWLFSRNALVFAVCLLLFALAATTGKWEVFLASYENLFSSWRWITIAASWCILKIIHEIAHGGTCRRYGGEVREAGIAMILLMPIAYVNVTSSWRFPSRWQRLHVTLAGVVVELSVAGIALLAWNWIDALPLKQAAADVVLMASVSTLLFNLNPLLKFDGYFALADLTGIDNLYGLGQSYARYFGLRYLLGVNAESPTLPRNRFGWIKWYGCCAAMYRVLTVLGLLTAAATFFHGAGILVAMVGVFYFVLRPLIALAQHLWQLRRLGEFSLVKSSLRFTGVFLLMVGPIWLIPASGSWTNPAIVEYSPPAVIRARTSGFVDQVHVVDGASVEEGDPIVTLSNDQLKLEYTEMRKELAQIEYEILAAQWSGNSSELADAEQRKCAREKQLMELDTRVRSLVVRSTSNGRVLARDIELLLGSYVEVGDELATIGREDSKRLKISISHTEASTLPQWRDKPVRVIVPGLTYWHSKLSRVESRSNTVPADQSLLAVNGGSLASRMEKDQLVLCEPRFNAYVELPAKQSRQLRCGQRAAVFLDSDQPSLGAYWLEQALRQGW